MAKKSTTTTTSKTKSEAEEAQAEHTPAPTEEPAAVVPAATEGLGQGEPIDPPTVGSQNIDTYIEQVTEFAMAEAMLGEINPLIPATPVSNSPASIVPVSIPPQPLAAKGFNNILIEGWGILVLNDSTGTANNLTRGIPQVVSDLVLAALEMEGHREKFRRI